MFERFLISLAAGTLTRLAERLESRIVRWIDGEPVPDPKVTESMRVNLMRIHAASQKLEKYTK